MLNTMAIFERIRPMVQIIVFLNVPEKSDLKRGIKIVKQDMAQISKVATQKKICCLFLIEINWLQITITTKKQAVL